MLNPSDPNVIFYTYPPRGGEISPPLVKSLFHFQKHVFSSCGVILLKISHILRFITKMKPNLNEFYWFVYIILLRFEVFYNLAYTQVIYIKKLQKSLKNQFCGEKVLFLWEKINKMKNFPFLTIELCRLGIFDNEFLKISNSEQKI